MGSKASKPLRDSARNVLARRQMPVPPSESSPSIPVTPQVPSLEHADLATPPPAPSMNSKPIDINPEVHSSSSAVFEQENPPSPQPPSSTSNSSAAAHNAAPLPPDLLAAISKWQVTKKVINPYDNGTQSISPIRFTTVAEIRQKKDLALSKLEEQNLPLVGKLTERQLHDFYKEIRDEPDIDPAVLAKTYLLTENVALLLMDTARLPLILKNDEGTVTFAH